MVFMVVGFERLAPVPAVHYAGVQLQFVAWLVFAPFVGCEPAPGSE